MSHRVRNWTLCGWATLTVGVLALHIVRPLPGEDSGYWAWPLGLMAFPVTAALILMKRPGNGVGRALGVVGMATFAVFFPWWYAVNYPDSALSRPAEIVSDVAVVPQFAGMIALLYLFPTGRPLNARHARVFTLFVWSMAAFAVLGLVRPDPLWATGRPSPLGVAPDWTVPVWEGGFALLLVFGLLGIGSLVVRWRDAAPIERAQLRWVLAAAVAAVAVMVLANVVPDTGGGRADIIAGVVVAATVFWSLPAAIVVAITRYRLYEIDRLISRTVAYALVVGLLVAVYAGGVFILSSLLPQGSDLAVAASTLVVAALFNPLRRRVQQRVDRRFNRPHYDADLEMERFADRLRTPLDLDDLIDELLTVAATTVQPSSATVWIRGERR
jgi:hypothetical protein